LREWPPLSRVPAVLDWETSMPNTSYHLADDSKKSHITVACLTLLTFICHGVESIVKGDFAVFTDHCSGIYLPSAPFLLILQCSSASYFDGGGISSASQS
jgi:hypothetical protein